MQDDATEQPKEVKGTILSPDQVTEWGNDINFIEPSVKDEQGNERRQEETDKVEENPTKDNTDDQEEEYDVPDSLTILEDPGEFVSNDYSFEVTVYDDEGKKGKTRKIGSVEEWESLLDEDPNLGTPAALLKAQRLATKMELSGERDKTEWQNKKDSFNKQNELNKSREEQITNIANEIGYLISTKKLPEISDEAARKRWQTDATAADDKEFVKTSGVKEQIELLSYMRKENNARQRAGLRPLTSAIDAYNAMQLENRDKKSEDSRKRAGEARREAGSRVAGVSPSPTGVQAPRGISVGRGGSLRDLQAGW